MRIALIQPDSPYLSYPLAFPSLGLLYISSFLKGHGFNPDYYDLTGGRKLPPIQADVIAFTCQITQYRGVLKMKAELEKDNPEAIFVIGGPFPTHSPKRCEEAGFKVVRGEGELPMLELLTGRSDPRKYVDTHSFPDWEAIELDRYGYGLEGKRCINIMTKRGNCPFYCSFCAKQEVAKSPLRFRSATNVLAEVDYLRTRGFEAVAIYDDDVLINKKRDRIIFEGLKERGMPYRCMTRSTLADFDDLKMLKETGCAEVAIGVESADWYIHDVICRKGTTIKDDTRFVQQCKEIGLRVKTYLIVGLPSETRTTVRRTKEWLQTYKPDNYDISIFTPYPGSHIYRHKGLYDINWDEKVLEDVWFSGEAQYGRCAVGTSNLTAPEILSLKQELENGRGEGGATSYWKPL